jgi:hypothetical protein
MGKQVYNGTSPYYLVSQWSDFLSRRRQFSARKEFSNHDYLH